MTTDEKGELAQLKVQLRALEKGLLLSRPTTPARYDFIVDDGRSFQRAQVKWGGCPASHASNAVQVDLRKDARGGAGLKQRRYLKHEIDLVLVYVPQTDQVLCFGPIQFHGKAALVIRYAAPKNGQRTGVTFANDFVW